MSGPGEVFVAASIGLARGMPARRAMDWLVAACRQLAKQGLSTRELVDELKAEVTEVWKRGNDWERN